MRLIGLGIAGLATACLLFVAAPGDARAGGYTIVSPDHAANHAVSHDRVYDGHVKRHRGHSRRHHQAHRRDHGRHDHDADLGRAARVFGSLFLGGQRHDTRRHRSHHYDRNRRSHTAYGRGHHQHGRACRAVTRVHRTGYGRAKVIAGTLCYDAYGAPYIVPGSRRVIGFVR